MFYDMSIWDHIPPTNCICKTVQIFTQGPKFAGYPQDISRFSLRFASNDVPTAEFNPVFFPTQSHSPFQQRSSNSNS